MDRLTSMAVFAKSVDLGSFSAAAEALSMSPQLVAKHVNLLEQQLGLRLLNRTTRRQSLTDAGRTYYERVCIILAEVEAADSLAAEARVVPRGRLKINAPVSFGIHALAPKLPDYLARYPEVSLEMTLSNRFVDVVEEGYDAIFRVGDLSDSGLIARSLAAYQLVVCAAPAYLEAHSPIHSPSDLQQHECLAFSHPVLRSYWTFEGPKGKEVVPIAGRMVMDSGEALLSIALAGMGVLLQPIELVRTELAAGRLVALLPEYKVPTRPLHILYAPDRRITPKLRSFIDFAVEQFG